MQTATAPVIPTHVVVATPFAVPVLWDPRIVSRQGTNTVREATSRALNDRAGGDAPRWDARLESSQRFHDYSTTLGDRLRDASAQWIVRRCPDSIHAEVAQHLPDHIDATFQGTLVHLELEGARLGIVELGFGALSLDFSVRVGRSAGSDGVERLEDLQSGRGLLDPLGPVVDRVIEELCAVVPAEQRLSHQLWLSDDDDAGCLWGHWLFVVDATPEDAVEALSRYAPVVDTTRPAAVVGDAHFMPGIGGSLLVGDARERDRVARVMALGEAHYAATASLERWLTVAAVAPPDAGRRPDVETAHDLIEMVSHHDGRLSMLTVHLAMSTVAESRMWEAIVRAWRLDRMRAEIGQRLDQIREAAAHDATSRTRRREELFTVVALVFTTITVLSTLFDVIEFGQGESLAPPEPVRLLVQLVLAALLAAITGWMLVRRRR